jgi:hypothetical protein
MVGFTYFHGCPLPGPRVIVLDKFTRDIKKMTSNSYQNYNTITPYIVDGIEFYVTDFECGISRAELAKFCGINKGSIRTLLNTMEYGGTSSKALNQLLGHSLYLPVSGENHTRIVRAQVCDAICKYYAFESRSKNVIALASYQKFSSLGMEAWIRGITGHPRKPTPTAEESAVQKLIHGVLHTA